MPRKTSEDHYHARIARREKDREESNRARTQAKAKAREWTVEQAYRLNMRAGEITDAIARGWLPEQIESVRSPTELNRKPPIIDTRYDVV